jgi:uncharacterized RDD family membrane protein YckC
MAPHDHPNANGVAPGSGAPEAAPLQLRLTAALLDNAFLPFLAAGTVSLVRQDLTGVLLTALLAAVITVVPEARTGRTPGKVLAGLVVVRRDGEAMDLRTALARRPWPLLAGLGFVAPALLPVTAGLLVLVAASIGLSRTRVGLHDRLTHTRVVTSATPEHQRRLALLLLTVLLVGTLSRLAFAPAV